MLFGGAKLEQKFSNQCFPAAYCAAKDHENECPIIVHGFIKSSVYWIVHAWCEVDEYVYDYTRKRDKIEKQLFYRGRCVYTTRIVKYTLDEYIRLADKYNNDGPFDEFLCKVPDGLIYDPIDVYEMILLEETNQMDKLKDKERKLLDSTNADCLE